MPYPNVTFDRVISSMSMHPWVDAPAVMRDLRRVLHPAGQIGIYDVWLALHQGAIAARAAFPDRAVQVEPIRTGRLPIMLLVRWPR